MVVAPFVIVFVPRKKTNKAKPQRKLSNIFVSRNLFACVKRRLHAPSYGIDNKLREIDLQRCMTEVWRAGSSKAGKNERRRREEKGQL